MPKVTRLGSGGTTQPRKIPGVSAGPRSRLLPPPGCGSDGRDPAGKGPSGESELDALLSGTFSGAPRPRQADRPAHPTGEGLPTPAAAPAAAPAPTQRCAAEEGGAGGGEAFTCTQVPLGRPGERGKERSETPEAPPPAPGRGNQLLGAEGFVAHRRNRKSRPARKLETEGKLGSKAGDVGERGLSGPWRCPVAPWS